MALFPCIRGTVGEHYRGVALAFPQGGQQVRHAVRLLQGLELVQGLLLGDNMAPVEGLHGVVEEDPLRHLVGGQQLLHLGVEQPPLQPE